MSKRAKTPVGLGVAGKALHRAITAKYELDLREASVLELACRQADDIAALEAIVAKQGHVVAGVKGQPRLSSIVTELRGARLALAKLLGELALPGEQAPETAAQRRGRKAARARWDRGNGLRAVR